MNEEIGGRNEQLAALGSHSKIYISVWNPHTRIAISVKWDKFNTRDKKGLRLRPNFSIYKTEPNCPGFMMNMSVFLSGLSFGTAVKECY